MIFFFTGVAGYRQFFLDCRLASNLHFQLIYCPILIIFCVDIPYKHTKQPRGGFFDISLFCTDNCNYFWMIFRRFSEICSGKVLIYYSWITKISENVCHYSDNNICKSQGPMLIIFFLPNFFLKWDRWKCGQP